MPYFCSTCQLQHDTGEICPKPIDKKPDFETYLMEKFCEGDGANCLDDDMPDAFSDWVVELDVDDIIKYANEYANKFKLHY